MAAHFLAHGYRVARNLVLEGRSGASHEVDVLAEKADALTTYRVAVECKAWRTPIEKDVVSKLAYVMSDLGLHKGIVVSLAGARSGAEQAAAGLGVELWGPDEVALWLPGQPGSSGEARGAHGIRAGLVLGLAPAIGTERGRRVLHRERSGRLRPGGEEVVSEGMVQVPAYELRLALTRGQGRARPRWAVTPSWNLYEALTGCLLEASGRPRPFTEVAAGPLTLRPLVAEARLAGDIRRARDRLASVATGPAQARHAGALADLGVDEAVAHVEVEEVRLVHLPFHLGLLRRRQAERLAAVDAMTGRVSPVVGAATTACLRQVVTALGWSPGPRDVRRPPGDWVSRP